MSSIHRSMRRPNRYAIVPPYTGSGMALWKKLLAFTALVLFCLILGFFYALFTPYLLILFVLPVAVLGVMAIWALPDMAWAPTGTLTGSFWAYILATLLWPNYLAVSIHPLPWITVVRLISLPMLLSLLTCISVSPRFRADAAGVLKTVPIMWMLVVAFVAIELLSILYSKQVSDSINKVIVHQTGWTAIFFISVWLFLKPKRVLFAAIVLCSAAVIASGIGLWENKLGHLPWAGHIPSFLDIPDPNLKLMLQGIVRAGVGVYRVQSTQTTPLGLAEMLALSMPFFLHFALGKYHVIVKTFCTLMIPILLYVILLTQSRLGLVGSGLGILLYVLAWAVRRWVSDKGGMIGISVTMAFPALFALALGVSLAIGRIRSKVWGGGAQAGSNQSRVDQFHKAVPMLEVRPWGFGVGQGTDSLGYEAPGSYMVTIDSYYLLLALDYGVAGLAVWFAIMLSGIYYGARYVPLAPADDADYQFLPSITIALAVFMVVKMVFAQADNHPIVFMMLGMIAALVYRIRKEIEASGREPPGPLFAPARRRRRPAARTLEVRPGRAAP
jgi:hypothetical protein